MGMANANSLLDVRMHEVELPDGTIKELTANAMAENLHAQCDNNGFMHQTLNKIVDH